MFDEKEIAEKTLEVLDGMVVYEYCFSVDPYICKQERDREKPKLFQNYPTMYVENMARVARNEDVEPGFCEYGSLAHIHLVRDLHVIE